MTYGEFKPLLLSKSIGRTVLPEDTVLKERVLSSMKLIAKETVVLKLLSDDPQGSTVLRRLDDELFVLMPNRPTEDDSELGMDIALEDALAFHVMAGLERQNANVLMGMYHTEIDFNNDRLVETFLSDTTNESYKQGAFV